MAYWPGDHGLVDTGVTNSRRRWSLSHSLNSNRPDKEERVESQCIEAEDRDLLRAYLQAWLMHCKTRSSRRVPGDRLPTPGCHDPIPSRCHIDESIDRIRAMQEDLVLSQHRTSRLLHDLESVPPSLLHPFLHQGTNSAKARSPSTTKSPGYPRSRSSSPLFHEERKDESISSSTYGHAVVWHQQQKVR